jgi:hypothetical protein
MTPGARDKIEALNKIRWVNPTKNPDRVIKWLEAGAKLEEAAALTD